MRERPKATRATTKGFDPAQGSPVWTVVAPETTVGSVVAVVDEMALVATTGTLADGLVDGLVLEVPEVPDPELPVVPVPELPPVPVALTLDVSPAAPHSSVAPLLLVDPL